MGFVLCPRCELNYMSDKDTYCSVCMQEVRGIAPREEVELCSICNENPVIPGKDVCAECLHEMENRDKEDSVDENDLDDGDGMDEIIQMDGEDDQDFGEIDHALSLESVREDEEREMEDDAEDSDSLDMDD